MSLTTSTVVGLDRTGDVWVGTFPGLGTVRVWADGRITAHAEPGQGPDADETTEQRHAALVHGWGEPLALARQGYQVSHPSALAPPAADGADDRARADGGGGPVALLVIGDMHDTAIVVLVPSRGTDTPTLTEVRGTERLGTLSQHVARQGLAPAVLGPQRCFEHLTALADAVVVQRLVRPLDAFTLDTVLDLIEHGTAR